MVRMLRVQRRLTQVALSVRAGASRRAISVLETGGAEWLRLREVAAIAGALGGRLDVRLFWNGPELDRLLDEGHAALGAAVKRRLEGWGWLVRVEVSYSHFGERGRVDLLAFHPVTGVPLVIELKTLLVDVQALLGSLDVKVRLGRRVADRFGWQVRTTLPAIVFLEHSATRKRLARVAPLFDRFDRRGRSAISWLRHPTRTGASGLLWFTPVSHGTSARLPSLGARQRVRQPRRCPRT